VSNVSQYSIALIGIGAAAQQRSHGFAGGERGLIAAERFSAMRYTVRRIFLWLWASGPNHPFGKICMLSAQDSGKEAAFDNNALTIVLAP
jgi:hypothetical protein